MSKSARKRTALEKALWEYYRAGAKLITLRDDMFPIGCEVESECGIIRGKVSRGSLYADNVKVGEVHCSINNLRKVNDDQ